MTDIAALKAAAEHAQKTVGYADTIDGLGALAALANPSTILSLIDRMEALEEALRNLMKEVEGKRDRAGSGYYDISFHDDDLRQARAALNTHPVTALEGE
jgi:hypothetical protein